MSKTCKPQPFAPIAKIRYLVISDIHLGNPRNPTWRIIRNLRTFFGDFKKDSRFVNLDLLFIDGDFFDKAMMFSNEDVGLIIGFILDLFDFCERYGIRVRYIEGTPSHDRKQFKNFSPVAANFPNLDYRYIEDMCVEAFYDLGITCLYVPDEHAGGGEKSQTLIDQLLKDLNIEKVSIAMVHSWYKYQIPEISSASKYDEKFFLDRVVYYISNGHVHIPSTYERIINQGSFDRIAHGEEHVKGGVYFEISKDEQYFFFLENKEALPFRTLHFKNKDLDECLAKIDKVANELPEYSWIRIKAKEVHPILAALNTLGQKYQHIRFEKITEEEEAQKRVQLVDQAAFDTVDYVLPDLNKHTIVDSVINEMIAKGTDVHDMTDLRQHLEKLV